MSRLDTMARFEQVMMKDLFAFVKNATAKSIKAKNYYYIAEMNICEDCIDYIRTAEVEQ